MNDFNENQQNTTEEAEEFETKFIETLDEDGNTVSLELLDIIELEGVEYAILRAASENEEDEDSEDDIETEAVLMRLKKDGDDYTFEEIEDDEEFNFVAEYIEGLEE